ncbi:ComEC/Rec2 family competence protein [Acetobacter vaccinii]|uniref:ComEC/Rec2 family competence protein n=1 Tax=Acetobacter vaccinii TaxID=2592655 RepID=A0A5C1YNA5_9PROT|nr:ComEC/Rec2 family competence protein [Acetobacter vaccinii]QEO16567.1 ComEC/Rec2 family competence protein [Acetobacter vaccinii]
MRGMIHAVEHQLLLRQRRLVVWVPVGVALGAAAFFALPWEPEWWTCLGMLLGSACAGVVVLAIGWGWLLARVIGGGCLAVALGAALAFAALHRQPPMPELPARAVVLSGLVRSVLPAQPVSGGRLLARRVELADVRFEDYLTDDLPPLRRLITVRLQRGDEAPIAAGDRLKVRAILRPPPFPALPGGRDRQFDAWFDGHAGTGQALAAVQVRPGGMQGLASMAAWFTNLRAGVDTQVQAALPGPVGAVASILLAGRGESLPASVRADFAASGLAHLLAVAGLHLGLVMLVVMGVVRRLLVAWPYAALYWPCKVLAAIVALAAGGFYVLLTGAHLPAQRGWLMAGLVVLALVAGRRGVSMRGLALAACVLLVLSPQAVVGVAFQMSMAAVMALVAGYDILHRPLLDWRARTPGFVGWLVQHVAGLAGVSLLAGLATLPVGMAHFGVIEPYFILANLIAVPLMAVLVMPAGLAALCLMPWHLAGGCLFVMGLGIRIIIVLAHGVACLPGAIVPVPVMPGWGLVLCLLGLCWLCLWSGLWRLMGVAAMAVGVLSPWSVARPDILLGPDGGLVGVRGAQALYVIGQARDSFLVEAAWAQALGLPVRRVDATQPFETPEDDMTCAEDGPPDVCLLFRHDKAIVLIARTGGEGVSDLCAGADGVVATVGLGPLCRRLPLRLDRHSAWWHGAEAVYLGGSVPAVRQARRSRLWVLRPGGHATPLLPLAAAE